MCLNKIHFFFTYKINEADSKVEDRFLKHELQMQLMAENMEGIM